MENPDMFEITGSSITAYPVYTVDYDNGEQETDVVGDTAYDGNDITVSSTTLGKGVTELSVTAGGFSDTISVYGEYKDGISVTYNGSNLEDTVLNPADFAVTYTYHRYANGVETVGVASADTVADFDLSKKICSNKNHVNLRC